jgi:SAM-dependent methyltransferase
MNTRIAAIPDLYPIIAQSPEVLQNDVYYWGYQYRLARATLVEQLAGDGGFWRGAAVAEIGCAEGGVLAAFVQAGASAALGTDIVQERLDRGEQIASLLRPHSPELSATPLRFTSHDVLFDEPHPDWLHAFDVVILRDVLEHLDDPTLALRNIQKLLKPRGYVFVEFPPYNSPFGGHQHLLHNTWGKIPYMHLLPDALFQPMTASGREPANVDEVRRLRHCRLTPRKFLQASIDAGYSLKRERYYLFRPVFKIKFGLPTLPLTALRWLPGVRSVLSLEANYLIQSLQ